ncbi:AP-3 complex subunit sigma-2 [Trichinella pseudospiralis]|uniref:AP-3 complex subunit sigma-2 n=1 Tax=Trichinella pseudospiralis TaxID=6337 RepID=A0A0V0Y9L4_TRIPS|nr:AP-3 complex subunit sigma-2 [Trichinella pseudospiralis]
MRCVCVLLFLFCVEKIALFQENKAKLNDVDCFVRTKCGRLYFDVFCDFLLRFKLFNTTKTLLAELGLNQESSLLGEKKYECYNLPGIFASESGMDLLNTISRSSASNDVHQNSCMDSHCNIGSQFVNSLFPSCSVKRMPQGMCAIRNGESRTSKTERRNFDEIYSKLEGLGKIPPSRSSANVPPEEQIAVDESAPSTASSRPKGEGFSFPELKGKVQPEKGNANLAIDHLLKKLSINEADSDTVEEYGKASDDSIAKDLEFDKSVYSDNSDDHLVGGSEYKLIYRHYATLYFVFCVDSSESELGILDLIQQVFVETLDRCFENVCELDLIFHADKVFPYV